LSRRGVAVLGLGNVGEPHLAAYAALHEVEVIAAVDPRADRLGEVCERYGIRGFAAASDMLGACRPDIVCVLTPAQTHRPLVELCAASGAHVLCEKPMAVTLADAAAMSRACVRAGVRFFYGSSYRYLPAVRAAKALIAAGAIGPVRMIIEEMLGGEGADAYRALSSAHYPEGGPGGGGYGLVDHGVHMLDVFPWLCESSIDRVFGRGDRTGQMPRPEFALLQMKNGASGMLVYDSSSRPAVLPSAGLFSEARGWIDGRGWMGPCGEWDAAPGNIRIFGSQGSINVFHYANKLFLNRSGRPEEQRLPVGSAPYHFAAQMQDFCASLDRGEDAPVTADDGVRALRALLALYASDSRGAWQDIAAAD
jgi:predicted dehydrogenase